MIFAEILKALSQASLVKINVDKSTKITVKDGSVSIGDQKITDQKLVKELTQKIQEDIRSHKDEESFPYQIIHEDILSDYTQYEEISKKNSKSLNILKGILPLDDMECILMARRVQMAYDKKDEKLALELLKQLDKNYPRKGRKIANLIKAGYFDELIIPMIDIYKNLNPEKYKEKFRDFFHNILIFFPTAVFVNNETTEEILEYEICKRLKLKTIPLIRIHSIGADNIKKVENVLEKIKDKIRFDLEDKRFITNMGIEAQNLEIKIKKNYFKSK